MLILGHRRPYPWRYLAAGVCALLLWPVAGCTGAAAAGARATGRVYYVDCAHGSDAASGTSADHAWRTLTKADSVTLSGGDMILFKRSTRCDGVFEPKGSGTEAHPVVAGAYGKGTPPVLAGDGVRATVVLDDVQGWTIRHLAVTDAGPTTEAGVLRTGIEVENNRLGTAHGITIEDDDISQVDTSPQPKPGASFENYSKAGGGIELASTAPNGFDDVLIADNTLTDVSREGIYIAGSVADGHPTVKGLVIRSNTLRDIGGDGIVAVDSYGALVERNTVDGFNEAGTSANAGIWAYHSTKDVFQYNVVSHGEHGPLDSMAFDIDGGNKDTVFQYNLSYDNTGGFLMLCNDLGAPAEDSGDVVRYNISQDDSAVGWRGVIDAPSQCGGVQGVDIYNNTIYTKDPSTVTMEENSNGSIAHFTNNVIVGPGVGAAISDKLSTWHSNLYVDVSCTVRQPDTGAIVADPALQDPGKASSVHNAGGYRLRARSPAIGAGVVVPHNGGRDFYGNPVPAHARPNIGAYQGPGVPGKSTTVSRTAVAPGCSAPSGG